MSGPPYMKMFWGDYRSDTPHLRKASEHGAYLLLIGALWSAGGKLSADDSTLASIACCTPKEWAALRPLIIPFFKLSRGRLTHKRVTAELEKYRDKIGKLKTAGKAGSQARAGKHRGNSAANAKQMLTYPEPEVSIEPIEGSISNRRVDAKARHEGAFAQRSEDPETDHLTAMDRLVRFLANQDEEPASAQAHV